MCSRVDFGAKANNKGNSDTKLQNITVQNMQEDQNLLKNQAESSFNI